MALTHHDDQEFVAGDDWSIAGLLLDINGNALDLTSALLEWTLVDPNGYSIPAVASAAIIQIAQPATGQITIKVPASVTEGLDAGRYHDGLRVTIGDTSTYWLGAILVDCDPFSLTAPPDQ